jgi:hypothetical protein
MKLNYLWKAPMSAGDGVTGLPANIVLPVI